MLALARDCLARLNSPRAHVSNPRLRVRVITGDCHVGVRRWGVLRFVNGFTLHAGGLAVYVWLY